VAGQRHTPPRSVGTSGSPGLTNPRRIYGTLQTEGSFNDPIAIALCLSFYTYTRADHCVIDF